MSAWDRYFHRLCNAVSTKSPCLSRKIGALIVRDDRILATGYNGPPVKIPHCGFERFERDDILFERLKETKILEDINKADIGTICPRRLMGYESGEGLQFCPAAHAEENAITNAARMGVATKDTTLYLNSVMPCKNCFGRIINAGIKEIVCDELKAYDNYSQWLEEHSDVTVRVFNLE